MSTAAHPALAPFTVDRLTLANRAIVAPMTRISATLDGVPTDRMVAYYRSFAEGGFGAVISEGAYTDRAYSQGYRRQPGLVTPAHIDGWRAVTDAVHDAGGVIFAQLMHAGALSLYLPDTIAPSAYRPAGERLAGFGDGGPYPTPTAMTSDHITEAISGFASAAKAAMAAGFDGIEVHGANGYLIDEFLTDYTNQREDHYGGSIEHRVRFGVEVVRAVQSEVPASVPVGIRLSQGKVNDALYEWPNGIDDANIVFSEFAKTGVDFLHVASEGRSWRDTARFDGDRSLTGVARDVSGLPIIANGDMHEPDLAARVLNDGHGDLISLGRGALTNRDWPNRIATRRPIDEFDPGIVKPWSSLENEDAWWQSR